VASAGRHFRCGPQITNAAGDCRHAKLDKKATEARLDEISGLALKPTKIHT
jgi:hypothetical protein